MIKYKIILTEDEAKIIVGLSEAAGEENDLKYLNELVKSWIALEKIGHLNMITLSDEAFDRFTAALEEDRPPSNPLLDALAAEAQELGFYDEPLPKENFDKFVGDL